MLQLTLRREFRGRRLGGTAIELENTKNTGATQMAAADFLELTYPSADALQSLEAVGPDRDRPLVLIGERGQGKSHLMALLHHAFTDAAATRAWLEAWSERLEDQKLAALPLRHEMHVISESLHRQRYKFLWDLLLRYALLRDTVGDLNPADDLPDASGRTFKDRAAEARLRIERDLGYDGEAPRILDTIIWGIACRIVKAEEEPTRSGASVLLTSISCDVRDLLPEFHPMPATVAATAVLVVVAGAVGVRAFGLVVPTVPPQPPPPVLSAAWNLDLLFARTALTETKSTECGDSRVMTELNKLLVARGLPDRCPGTRAP